MDNTTMATHSAIDINKVCRTCLKEGYNMKSVFSEELPELTIATMIKTCTVTDVSETDGLPPLICLQCIQDITLAYRFKEQCEKAYQTLLLTITKSDNEKNHTNMSSDNGQQNSIIDFASEIISIKLENESTHILGKTHNNLTNKEDIYQQYDGSIEINEADVYLCVFCCNHYNTEKDLKIHIKTVHKNDPIKCQICSRIFSRLNPLKKHMENLHPELFKRNRCEICNKEFTNYNDLQNHVSLNDCIALPEDINCSLCKMTFNSEELFKLHQDDCKEVINLTEHIINDDNFKSESLFNESGLSMVDELQFKCEPDEMYKDSYEIDIDAKDRLNDSESDFNLHTDNEININPKRKRGRPKKTEILNSSNGSNESVKFSCEQSIEELDDKQECTDPSEIQNKSKRFHECLKCNKSFTRAAHLRRHEMTHSEVKPFECKTCNKRFTRIDHLNIHMAHHNDKLHECELCPKGFTRSEHLKRHVETRHTNKQPITKLEFCTICKKGYSTAKYLQIHMRVHSDKKLTCKFCPTSFENKQELNEHVKTHVNERPFLCSECGLRFVRNDYLVIHMRRHKGEKPYKCKFCDKGFPRATDLTVHERYHTGEKTHLCTTCGKGFQRAYNLLVHMRVHTGERPYQCPHCPKKFAQGNDLKAHIRRHTGERYKCDMCNDGFIQGYHLTQHKRNVHGIDMRSHIRRVEKFIPSNRQDNVGSNEKQHNENIESQKVSIELHQTQDIKDEEKSETYTIISLSSSQNSSVPILLPPQNIILNSAEVSVENDRQEQNIFIPQIIDNQITNNIPLQLFSQMHQKIKLPQHYQY